MDGVRALAAERAEGERLRAQLARLKEQLVRGQEEEEEALAWRVEAEVRGGGGWGVEGAVKTSAVRRRGAAGIDASSEPWPAPTPPRRAAPRQVRAAREDAARREAELSRQLEAARVAAAADDGGAALAELLAAREAELATLQGALGEMAFEVEAAERMRAELRAARDGADAAARERDGARAALEGAREGGAGLAGVLGWRGRRGRGGGSRPSLGASVAPFAR
jgi:DNA repair exonuclease SbcCD ATPase subunit